MRAQPKKRGGRGRARRGGGGGALKGLAAGAVGGLAAAFVMNQFQAALGRAVAGEERSHGAQSLQQGTPRQGVGRDLQAEGVDHPEDDATERLANAISVGVLERRLTEREKDAAGTAFHYAMGLTSGALYGVLAELVPAAKSGAGLPFGMAVWLIADEGLVPAAGLSKSAEEYPLSIHAYSVASHLVFGLTAETVRRAVRSAL
jgi:putative membrane protein